MIHSDKTDVVTMAGKNSSATRKRLLDSARNLFSQANYARVTVRDIAAEAGVAPALINRYFGSKKMLFVKVAESLGRERQKDEIDGLHLKTTVDALNTILKEGAHGRLMTSFRIAAFSALDPEVSEIIYKTFDRKRELIMSFLEGENTATRAELILSLFLGGAMVVNLLRGDQSPHIDIEYMIKFYERLLADLFRNYED